MSTSSEEEIWAAVRSLGANKSLGQNGFSAILYLRYWNTVKLEVLKMVHKFFDSVYLLKEINHSNIVLIAKVENPTVVVQYHLISLCNVA